MTVKRRLPSQFNHLLSENFKKDELVDLRRLGQTRLMSSKGSPAAGGSSPQMTLFSYVHLRAPLPHDINPEIFGNGTKPEAYFLMRRSKDGYVSSTGMFKASFPWATKAEEDLERRYVKAHFDASPEETAGNLWVHPNDALILSSDYRCRVWIEALVDEKQVNTDNRNKDVTPPPPYKSTETTAESLNPTPTKSRGRTRSASPSRKIAQPRKSRTSKASLKESSTKVEPVDEETTISATEETSLVNGSTTISATATTTTTITKTEEVTNGISEEVVQPDDSISHAAAKSNVPDGDNAVKVEVETTTETKGDVVIESTHVKVELSSSSDIPLLPESPEEMIAKAKEMVAEAMKAEEGSESISSKKRKIEEATASSTAEDVPDIETLEISSPPRSKRARVMGVIKEEKFQRRALLGIGATVAIGGLALFSNLI